MLNWTHDTAPNAWNARDEIAKHFIVKYELWGDEDDVWYGQIKQWWRQIGKEDDQYADLSLKEYGIHGIAGFEAMSRRVEQFHENTVRPEVVRWAQAYAQDEEIGID